MSLSRSTLRSILRIASAPISALKPSSYLLRASAYSSSERIWPFSRGVPPFSITSQSW